MFGCYIFCSCVCRSLAKAKTSETATEEGTSQQDKGQANMELITKPGVCMFVSV